MDSVAPDCREPIEGWVVFEFQGYKFRSIFKSKAVKTKMEPILADAFLEGVQKGGLQVAAMDRVLRPLVSGTASERLAIDELAEAVKEHRLLRFHAHARERRLEAQSGENLGRMRKEIHADPDRLDLG